MTAPGQTRSAWLAAWLLPVLVLRALVPSGFMAAPSAHGVELVFCGGAHDPARPAKATDASCPFALSAGPAPLAQAPQLVHGIASVGEVRPLASEQAHVPFGPARLLNSRGPPPVA